MGNIIRKNIFNEKKSNSSKIFIILMIFVAVLIFGYGGFIIIFSIQSPNISINDFGVFGDSFGILSSFFTSLAFIGALWAIYLQRKDVEATLEELKQSREASEKSTMLLNKQNKIQATNCKVSILTTLIEDLNVQIREAVNVPKQRRNLILEQNEYIKELKSSFNKLKELKDGNI